MRLAWPRSLRRRLIVQLLLFQIVILSAFGAILVAYILHAGGGVVLASPDFAEAAAKAIVREPDGTLRLEETPDLAKLRQGTPDLWFLARSSQGEIVETGSPPVLYRMLAEHLDRIYFADIRDDQPPFSYLAVARRVTGPAGEFVVLGKGPVFGTGFVVLVLSNILMLPILAVLVIVTVVVIPWIVGRAFARLAEVAGAAEKIDVDRRGYRLPRAEVPTEIHPLVSAINGALQRLDDGYERQRRFILDAAHELRTPIAILQTRLDAVQESALKARLQADIGRIASLAEQLLDMQRMGQEGASFRRLELVSLCRNVVADLAPLAISAGYELSLEGAAAPIFVEGDQGALERVVTNLVQNAIDHGGGRGRIVVNVEADGIVEVMDEGPGVPESEREAIFEPFHRLRPREQGAGLGLNLVREIVARHGGQIAVLDRPGGGALFVMHLPHASMSNSSKLK